MRPPARAHRLGGLRDAGGRGSSCHVRGLPGDVPHTGLREVAAHVERVRVDDGRKQLSQV